MVLEGRLFIQNRMTDIKEVRLESSDPSFAKNLEQALILLCRELSIPTPLWMKKNTHEFAAFHQTMFFGDQFTEKVKFDRFQITMIE